MHLAHRFHEDNRDFPGHFLEHLKNHHGYNLSASNFRVLVGWDKDEEMLYRMMNDTFERKKDGPKHGTYRERWGPWRDGKKDEDE